MVIGVRVDVEGVDHTAIVLNPEQAWLLAQLLNISSDLWKSTHDMTGSQKFLHDSIESVAFAVWNKLADAPASGKYDPDMITQIRR